MLARSIFALVLFCAQGAHAQHLFQSYSGSGAMDTTTQAAINANQRAITAHTPDIAQGGGSRPKAAQQPSLGPHAQYHGFGVVSNSLNFSTSWTANNSGQIPDLDTHVLLPAGVGATAISPGNPNGGSNTPYRPWGVGTAEFSRNVYRVQPNFTLNTGTASARLSQDVDGKNVTSGGCARGGSICEQVSITGNVPGGTYIQQTYRTLAGFSDPIPNFSGVGSSFQTQVWTTRALAGPGIIVDNVTVGGIPQLIIKRPDGTLSVATAAMGGTILNDTGRSAEVVVNTRASFARGIASDQVGKQVLEGPKSGVKGMPVVAHTKLTSQNNINPAPIFFDQSLAAAAGDLIDTTGTMLELAHGIYKNKKELPSFIAFRDATLNAYGDARGVSRNLGRILNSPLMQALGTFGAGFSAYSDFLDGRDNFARGEIFSAVKNYTEATATVVGKGGELVVRYAPAVMRSAPAALQKVAPLGTIVGVAGKVAAAAGTVGNVLAAADAGGDLYRSGMSLRQNLADKRYLPALMDGAEFVDRIITYGAAGAAGGLTGGPAGALAGVSYSQTAINGGAGLLEKMIEGTKLEQKMIEYWAHYYSVN
jgi:hypothetical protein